MSTHRPIRVAHVVTKFALGGAQHTALAMCAGLRARGYDAVIMTGLERDEEGTLHAEAEALGVPVVAVPHLVRAVSPLDDLRALRELRTQFRRWRPDIVQTHSSKAGVLGRVAARLAGVPAVHTVHGWSFHDQASALHHHGAVAIERLLAPWTERFVVVSDRERAKGVANAIGRDETYAVIRSGVPLGDLRPRNPSAEARKRLGLPSDGPLVGTVGRLADPKDPDLFVHVAAAVLDKRPDVRFVWVGDGPRRAATEALAATLGVRDRVLFTGARRDVADVLSQLDVFVLSSRWEAMPRTLVEAAACEVPIVATAVGGVGELVEDGETGLLCPPGDRDALAAAIVDVLDDPVSAEQRARRLRPRVDEFGESAMIDRLVSLYDSIVARPRPLRVAHVASGLEVGGAERMLQRLVVATADSIDHTVISLTGVGVVGRELQRKAIDVRSVGLRMGPAAVAAPFRLDRILRGVRPDVVHTWLYHGDLVGGVVARARGLPVVWSVRQTAPDPHDNSWHAVLAARLCARLSRRIPSVITCNSQAAADDHITLGYDASRMVVINNGVDVVRFGPSAEGRHRIRRELDIDDDAPVVAMVARVDPQKDHRTFVEAVARLVERRSDLHAVLCGRGTAQLTELVDGLVPLDHRGNVHLLGERADVPAVVAAADVMVSTSAFGESFPNAIAEAMATEVPVIVSDLPGSTWLVEGVGRVAPVRDAVAFADAIDAVLSLPPAARAALGVAGRRRIVERFAMDVAVQRYSDLYASLAVAT